MCKFCSLNPVYTLTNKRQLCSTCFQRYVDKKVFKTIRKMHLNTREINSKNKLLSRILQKNFTLSKKARIKATGETADDISVEIIESQMRYSPNMKKLFPRNQNHIRPFYFVLNKELAIYSMLVGIKFKPREYFGKKKKIKEFLDHLEEKHPEIKNNIVHAFIKSNITEYNF